MRVGKEQAAENRDRVVVAAGRLLRERGIDGVGVDALMEAAGLTHGGFYKSFNSKEALVAEACERAMANNAAKWPIEPQASKEDMLRAWVTSYLSPAHCAGPGEGCVFAALAADAGRREGSVRQVFTRGLAGWVERLARLLPGRAAKRRERALATIAAVVGAVVLARAVNDDVLRSELLDATAIMVLGGKDGPVSAA